MTQTDQPCLEVPFDEVEKWEKIQGSCARFYAAAEWGYKQALATPPPEPPTDEELDEFVVFWWGAGRRGVTNVIESDSMAAFARAVLERWGQ